ncbi:hypothetical protein BP5796_07672 [Coleophoma crateriformis]|uniref:Xylanolytic transcriptional activator regulatory domain-containing protein n=1 Tax=Coleophoma crateriformis TaxID=565419 RepID=A0A3D8RJT2_9HELO|nr:hypothetical protein BP5796_07672 [Coleophoma crateriformis]
MVQARVGEAYDPSEISTGFQQPRSPTFKHSARSYTESYFLHIHPVYPFLDRVQFERRASDKNLPETLKVDKAWCALYFTVLALGSQFHDEGTFDQGKGKPWKLFQVALGTLPELILPSKRLLNAQAIFALTFSCLSILEMLVTEAVRIATAMDLHICVGSDTTHVQMQRTFWTIYNLEKEFCFLAGRASAIADYDIGSPVPKPPREDLGELNWLLLFVRHSRILSKAYEKLFSISATLNSTAVYLKSIDTIRGDLDGWKDSLPPEMRPGSPFRQRYGDESGGRFLTLKIHFAYHHVLIALSRLTLHVCRPDCIERLAASESELIHSARSVIHLTQNIDLAPYTPTWILGYIPLSALFILFDFVIHNPAHPDTRKNLAFLDIAAGYFTRLEFATDGSLQSSLLAEFAHIARQYVQDFQNGKLPPQDKYFQTQGRSDGDSTGAMPPQSNVSPSSETMTRPDPTLYELPQYEYNDNTSTSNPEGQTGSDFMYLFGNSHTDIFTSESMLSFDPALYESQYLPWE